ncbi:MAG: rhodanese-like domain-containing protein [Prevotellaceae bacterium]|jgi:rhodanese-related sulfurtransferase|nr:rhodanese-like domain-containing protein [Prevotellaceae bacterium]
MTLITFRLPLFFGFMLCLIPIQAQKIKVSNLKPDVFKAKIEQTVNPCIIDVRSSADFAYGHISHAINLDPLDFLFIKEVKRLCSTSDTIFVYCKMGKTSKTAAQAIVSNGFKQVVSLKGGILAWEKKKFPVVME